MRGTNKELPMFAGSFILLFTRWLLVGKVSMKTGKRRTSKEKGDLVRAANDNSQRDGLL